MGPATAMSNSVVAEFGSSPSSATPPNKKSVIPRMGMPRPGHEGMPELMEQDASEKRDRRNQTHHPILTRSQFLTGAGEVRVEQRRKSRREAKRQQDENDQPTGIHRDRDAQ